MRSGEALVSIEIVRIAPGQARKVVSLDLRLQRAARRRTRSISTAGCACR